MSKLHRPRLHEQRSHNFHRYLSGSHPSRQNVSRRLYAFIQCVCMCDLSGRKYRIALNRCSHQVQPITHSITKELVPYLNLPLSFLQYTACMLWTISSAAQKVHLNANLRNEQLVPKLLQQNINDECETLWPASSVQCAKF